MKKLLFITSMLLAGAFFSFAEQVPAGVSIIFHVANDDGETIHGERPRSPVCPPSACLDDHTLYISGEHSDYTLYLVDTSGEEPDVVYQVYVPANVNAVILPATLTGTYELQLYDGGEYYFYSEIEL